MKLFKNRKRKLLKNVISLACLGVGATATAGLAVMGVILAILWNKRTSGLTKFMRVLRHFF